MEGPGSHLCGRPEPASPVRWSAGWRGSGLPALLALALVAVSASAAAQPSPTDLLAPPAAAPGPEGEEAPAEEGEEDAPPGVLDLPMDPFSASAWRTYGYLLVSSAVDFLPNLARALIVLAVFFALFRVLVGVFRRLLRRTRADPSIVGISTRLIKYVLFVFAVVMAASELGFNVGSLLAGIGIVGLALGLAAQESLGNVVAGLTILWDRPYRVGDNVTIADTFGRVQEIGLRTTRILTVEHLDAILPNRQIVQEKILNHTANPQLRLGVAVAIAYREDTREARRALLAAVEGHRLILDDPPPAVVVTSLADSGVLLELRMWLRDPHEEREALFEMTEIAKLALDEAGIEIPFPQRTLHFAGPVPDKLPDGGAGPDGVLD